jgi:hypothetical protein
LVGAVSRRIAQLNFSLGAREVSAGMTSRVLRLRDPATGETAYSGWLRTQDRSVYAVYVGLYGRSSRPAR